MENFEREFKVGEVRTYNGQLKPVTITIKWDEGRLSLQGQVGLGRGCIQAGQIEMSITNPREYLASYTPGWTPEAFAELVSLWRRWHLNDMHAGCEHQRATWAEGEQLEVRAYGLTSEATKLRDNTIQAAARATLEGLPFEPSPTARMLAVDLRDSWFKPIHELPPEGHPLRECYELRKTETKPACQILPTEHPKGLLTKPCEVCGYRYGSQWLREEVPEAVLVRLRQLPEGATDATAS